MRRTFLLLITTLLAASTLSARDFDVVSPSGHTLYCDIVQGGVAIVGWDYSRDSIEPISLVIPAHVSNGGINFSVIAIGAGAFRGGNRLFSVSIPSSVKTIGEEAFCRCFGLGSFVVPSSVDSIGPNAFLAIPNVEYNGSLQGAPWGAMNLNAYKEGQYYYSDSLKTKIVCCERDASDATIPSTVTSIGEFAFAYCFNIRTVRIDSVITKVGSSAFGYCNNLESVYFEPGNQTDLEAYIFEGCQNLRQLTLSSTMTELPLGFCKNCTSLQEIVIPDNITKVGSDAFLGCTSLERAVVGNGIERIGMSMFEGCTSLKEVVLPECVREINYGAFCDCKSLREIVLPVGVNYIGYRAYAGCDNVSTIVCMNPTVPNTSDRAFDSIDTQIDVYVPCNKASLYSQDAQWGRFENFKETSYYVVVTSNNIHWGSAVATKQPSCDDNTATIEATPEEGYRFVKWDDNNTDNPRQIAYNGQGYVYRKAIFESTVGVQEAEPLPEVKVYASNGGIVVDGAQGEQVWVYDIMGRQLYNALIRDSIYRIQTPSLPFGIYLVKVGNHKTQKVAVRR